MENECSFVSIRHNQRASKKHDRALWDYARNWTGIFLTWLTSEYCGLDLLSTVIWKPLDKVLIETEIKRNRTKKNKQNHAIYCFCHLQAINKSTSKKANHGHVRSETDKNCLSIKQGSYGSSSQSLCFQFLLQSLRFREQLIERATLKRGTTEWRNGGMTENNPES